MAWRRNSALILAAIVAVVVAAGFYFLKVNPLWSQVKKGLDIQGGIHVVFEGVDAPGMPVTPRSIEQAKGIIEQRVNRLGVAEPVIQRQGESRIIVELPGIRDPEKALEVIGRTALLEFKDEAGKTIVTGKDLDSQAVDVEIQPGGGVVVTLRFKKEGAARFAAATREAVKTTPHKTIAIVLDNQIMQQPVVSDAIENGQAVITGYNSVEDARRIAISLQSGALPVRLNMVENRTISPTLGKDSLNKSEAAAVIGIVLVLAFMFLFYRIPGLWADFALFIYLLLFLGLLVSIKATLTLPGIAGFVLSIGMAVDANVIIFERIKEELRLGKTIRSALDAGFENAFRAIFDSNATTLLGASILFWLGSGPVRGFALTLALGVILSMFTAIVITRFVLRLLVNAGLKAGPFFFATPGGSQTGGGTR